jgi:general secretion pathway protein D
MHVEVEISSVQSYVNLGGIQQPIIAQEKVIHDVRMKDGEVNLLGGLRQMQDSTTVTGIPGLSSIPVIKWLFSSKSIDKSSQELLIALVPHIVRRPDYSEEELRGIAVGNATVVKLNYAPRADGAQDSAPKGTKPVPPGAPNNPIVVSPSSSVAAPAPSAPPPPNPAHVVTPPISGSPAAAPTPNDTAIAFVPAQIDTIMGGTFTVSLTVANGADVFSAPLQLQFDPKILKLNDVTQGTLMSSDGGQVTFTKNIQNDAGTADVTLNRLPGTPGVTGSGMLATFAFTTIGRGATTISAPSFSPMNSQGQTISNSSPLVTVNVR